MFDLKTVIVFLLVCIPIALLVVAYPFAVIWGLNQLFGLALEYSFFNWLAIFILGTVFGSFVRVKF